MIYNPVGIAGYIALGFLADAIGRKPVTMLWFLAGVVLTPVLGRCWQVGCRTEQTFRPDQEYRGATSCHNRPVAAIPLERLATCRRAMRAIAMPAPLSGCASEAGKYRSPIAAHHRLLCSPDLADWIAGSRSDLLVMKAAAEDDDVCLFGRKLWQRAS